jgi:hypothetical protein
MNPDRPSAWSCLGSGIGVVCRRPQVVVALLVMSLLMAWAVAAPVQQSAAQTFSYLKPFPGDESFNLDRAVPRWMFEDWGRQKDGIAAAASSALGPLLLLSSLIGVFLAGCWMQIALSKRKDTGLGAFLAAGGQHFWPFLRLWFMALAGYALVSWIVWGMPGNWLMAQIFADGNPALASDERTAWWVQNIYLVVYLFGLLKVEILIDLARASLVSGQRRSAVAALLRAVGFWLRRWYAALFLVGSGLILEAIWVALAVVSVRQFGLPLWSMAISVPIGRLIFRSSRLAGIALLFHRSTLSPAVAAGPPNLDESETAPGHLDEGSAWGISG